MKVLAAMSGGVDSAVAAARAVDAGHDVVGVHLALSAKPATLRDGARGCCTLEDAHDARRAADVIGIPFYVWDLAERFRADVIDDFVAEYAAGRTPTCLRCARRSSSRLSWIITRARLRRGRHRPPRGWTLVCCRSVDLAKDQSYVLAVCFVQTNSPTRSSRSAIPPRTRSARRRRRGWLWRQARFSTSASSGRDTQGSCTSNWGRQGPIATSRPAVPSGIIAAASASVGQRRGRSDRTADGRPRYVLSISSVRNTVTVGTSARLEVDEVIGTHPVWTSGAAPGAEFDCTVQVRAHGRPIPARVGVTEDGMTARLRRPERGVAAGQAVVCYAEDVVLGSATITETVAVVATAE
jgi:tRNA-specific 2-thiouridylase